MPKKILFAFAGTEETAQQVRNVYEDGSFRNDVIRVYFNGAQDRAIGGAHLRLGCISPNLDVVAKGIRESFDNQGHLSLFQLKKTFGKAIIIEPNDSEYSQIEVEQINLTGYSRGAVTTFAVARHLDELGKPIRLFAEDPVPGNSKNQAKKIDSEFFKNHDLSGCTHLVEAQVILGAYKKNVIPPHNKFFRQMVPLFGNSCKSNSYIVPKTHHWHFSHKCENQRTDFLVSGGIKSKGAFFHKERDDRMTFIPKIIQQKHHKGRVGQIEMLPRYKNALFDLVSESCTISRSSSIKIAQALYALHLVPSFADKEALISLVQHDTTVKGKAIREFIVEFENINQYVFRKPYSLVPILRNDQSFKGKATAQLIKITEKIYRYFFRKTVDEKKKQDAMNLFRGRVYDLLHNFPIETATAVQKKELARNISTELKNIKRKLSSTNYQNLNYLITLFLKENMIFHLDLTQYIDETETFDSGPQIINTGEQAIATLSTVKTGTEMAEMLYHMSKNSRSKAYNEFPKALHEVITDSKQLGDILRFLPIKHMEKILKNKKIRNHIKSIDDINSIMNKMFYPAHQQAFYKAMKNNSAAMDVNLKALGELMSHLPPAECKRLIASIKWSNVKKKSSANFIAFFEKLNDTQFNEIFPKIAAEMKGHLDKQHSELLGYLEKRITAPKVRDVFEQSFPNVKVSTHRFKLKLAELKEHPEPLSPQRGKNL